VFKYRIMKGLANALFFLVTVSTTYSQEWIIVDILEQSKKELVYKVDNGEEVKRETVKNPSIVKLIKDYQAEGFQLKAVTQGVELELNGNLPMINNRNNNFGIANLNLVNNTRIMLWFEKKED
jgi:hypothetical protein